MFQNHELYRMEHEERLRKAKQFHLLKNLPGKQNFLLYFLNQVRMFLF